MFTPTTGSPTITLFQLRSNYYTVLNSHKSLINMKVNQHNNTTYIVTKT